jgi:cyclopropane-fatty-acyl-phospholipid synthase
MTDTIIPHGLTTNERDVSPRGGPPWRSLVHRGMRSLGAGSLTIHDGAAIDRYGTTDAATDQRATLTVHDARFYRRVALGGSLGAAESYLRGEWSTPDLTGLLQLFVRNLPAADEMEGGLARLTTPLARLWHRLRSNSRTGSRKNIHAHYDLGNEFFEMFLDETMTYSCGIFERDDATMAEASRAKLDRICRKLELTPDDHVLEIGTGWGSFAIHAAGHYGCRVTTTTISREQHDLAAARIREAGLEDRIDLRLQDYRDLDGVYDKLVSIEMIEAVGHEYLGEFFRRCADLLKPDGRMVLQAITMPDQRYDQYRRSVDFIQRFVFPGSCVPSVAAMMNANAASSDLKLAHLEEFGAHYATTLRRWREAFFASSDEVRAQAYPESFIRLWEYYLCYCEAGFAERYIGAVQMTLHKSACRCAPAYPALEGAR